MRHIHLRRSARHRDEARGWSSAELQPRLAGSNDGSLSKIDCSPHRARVRHRCVCTSFRTRIAGSTGAFVGIRGILETRRCIQHTHRKCRKANLARIHATPALHSSRFFETHREETYPSPKTGKPIKRQYEFRVPEQDIIFIGCTWRGSTFSMVTTDANADMAPIHHRMPLIVRQEELPLWFGPKYQQLADRFKIRLQAQPA